MSNAKRALSLFAALVIMLTSIPFASQIFAGGDSIIKSIVFDDVTVMEGTQTTYTGWDGEQHTEYFYELYYTVELKDGETMNLCSEIGESVDPVYIYGQPYFFVFSGDTQNKVDWEVGNTYSVSATLEGAWNSYHVTVIENPVASINVEDYSLIEGTRGHWGEVDAYDNLYYHYDYIPTVTVTMKDGSTVETDDEGRVWIVNGLYQVTFLDDQADDHWTLGNTYYCTASLLGAGDVYKVTIRESPVKSLSVENCRLIANANGRYESDGGGGSYYRYEYYPEFTVTLKDDTVIHSNGARQILVEGDYYSPEYFDSQEFFHWTVGNSYTVGASFLGATTEFKVSIVANPVKTLKVENTAVFEGYDDHIDYDESYNSYQRYSYEHLLEFSVVLKDNTIIKSEDHAVEIYGVRYQLTTHDTQSTNHWTAGANYDAGAELFGVTSSFKVRVIPNPVVSLSAHDVNLVEEFDGYWYTGEGRHYFIYTVPTSGVTASFNDGAVLTSDETGCIEWKGRRFYVNSYTLENNDGWTTGKDYHGIAEFFRKSAITEMIHKYIS